MMKCGGWNYADMPACSLPQDAATAFEKATKGFCGSGFVPVLFVGTQLVSGTNYCIVCKSTLTTNPPIVGCKTLFIYEDLKGNCSITKIDDIIDYD